ncbi:MAG: hypothetical protein IJV27_12535 [Prevotella sp.]|nr:hypothetical protein [Prevotella sp.]
MRDPSSPVRKAILKGELQATFAIEQKLLSDAKSGNQTSAKAFSDMVRERSFKLTKLDLFGGSEDSILFEHVQQFLEHGTSDKFGADEQLYIQALQLVYSFQTRFGDRKTIKLLAKEPFNLSYDRAKDMLTESVELFNSGRRNTKQAMRYHIAESYDTLYHAILETAKTPQDFAIAAGILDKKAKLLQLDQPEIEEIKPELYPRKFIVSSLTPEAIGLPAVNRDALASQIKELGLQDADMDRLEREAGVKDFDIIKALDHADTEED